ncbi:MAG: DUF4365 domain-containing protein [Verrucomicrobiae bacterium]|nr:DUF4365 domain-containing protein [Verrucomicrobiae bacterium]
MGSRPRKHQLEDQSEVFFRKILPPSWVFRRESPDYGTDGIIEIFTKEGVPTGLRTLVQLKATDSKDEKTQRCVRFKTSTWEYWQLHDIPTLIVRYIADSDRFYYAWNFDRRIEHSKNRKNSSLKFSDKDQWGEESPDEIFARLFRLRKIRNSALPLPIAISFSERRGTFENDPRDLLRDEMKKYSRLIRYEDRRPEAEGVKIHFLKNELLVDLDGLSSIPIRLDVSRPDRVAADLVVGASFCYGSVGQNHIALKLLELAYGEAEHHACFDVARILSRNIIQTREFDLLFRITRDLWERGLSLFGAECYLFGLISNLSDLNEEEQKSYFELLFDCVNQTVQRKEKRAGRMCYNLGEILANQGKFRYAVRYFKFACLLDFRYAGRDYLFIQASGVLYRSKKYKAAVSGYLRALRLSNHSKPTVKALLGDSQLMRGRIGSACYWMAKAVNDERLAGDPRLANFVVMRDVASQIRMRYGVRIFRNSTESNRILSKHFNDCGSYSEEVLEDSLGLDRLNAFAWNELGVFYAEQDRLDEAFIPFYFAAALSNGNVRYWMNIIILAFTLRTPPEFCTLVIAAASVYGADNLADEAHRRASLAIEGDHEVLRRFGETLAELSLVERPAIMRVVRDD